jgi:DNA-binding GntR family transcriptional regulator
VTDQHDRTPRGVPLRVAIRDTLRTRIFEGYYPVGTRLIERDLAAEFGVSWLPVREAVRMLVQEGLLAERSTRGAIVADLTEQQARDLFDVRSALEVLASRLAAQRATPADIATLRGLVDTAAKAVARNDIDAAHRANSALHDDVTAIAGNPFLRTALEPLQGRMHWLFRHVTDMSELVEEHRTLVEAIASGDPDRAVAHGGVDGHCHVAQITGPYRTLDDYAITSVAALWGGTTTIMDFGIPSDATQTPLEAAEAKIALARAARCDVALHGSVIDWDPTVPDQLTRLAELGVRSVKLYMTNRGTTRADNDTVLRVMREMVRLDGLTYVHAEHDAMIAD